ncbi:NAD-P-binding protein [Mycena albidolilacea]|uniref:NAD-P-binding protein n=1 Tax=Mycena albidolilacea TaxID=1033008 RepID=A0AAD7AVR2_9AGAR|nr:NAD-P-binding protein [Mycena albidolilacea]
MSASKLPPPVHVGSWSEKWPPRPTWTQQDVPDLTGKIFLCTGGSAGIGKETCHVLVARNAKVYLAGRNSDKALAGADRPCRSCFRQECCRRVHLEKRELHVLINKGGVLYAPSIGPLTAEGYDVQFGVDAPGLNHPDYLCRVYILISGITRHYCLIMLLMPTLLRIAKGDESGIPHPVRVVAVLSGSHFRKRRSTSDENLKLAGTGYGQSKLSVVLISSELAGRYGDQGIISISLHPGASSSLLGHQSRTIPRRASRYRLDTGEDTSVPLGIITPLYAATSEEAFEMNGEVIKSLPAGWVPSKHAQNKDMAERLWKWCEEQVSGFRIEISSENNVTSMPAEAVPAK